MIYYNENHAFAAQWLRNLSDAGHVARGRVDDRSIRDVDVDAVRWATQAHFFAGIGVWSYALRLAGWPDDRAVWTGSCPCQPFSDAGAGAGFEDERHLWPVWFELIRQCRPGIIIGEQVSSANALVWLDLVRDNLESENYAFAALDICAAGVGTPHMRQRFYWVAYLQSERRNARRHGVEGQAWRQSDRSRAIGRMADGNGARLEINGEQSARQEFETVERSRRAGGMADTMRAGRPEWRPGAGRGSIARSVGAGGMGHAESIDGGLSDESRWFTDLEPARASEARGMGDADSRRRLEIGRDAEGDRETNGRRPRDWLGDAGADDVGPWMVGPSGTGALYELWQDPDWLLCRDGRWRPVEPGTFPLAHGIAGRVGRLRAYGNAIVAPQAATFIRAVMEILQ